MSSFDTLCVETTLRCPLRCIHCSANAAPERTEMIPAEVLAKRLNELRGLHEVYLSGGEPFEHPALPLIVNAASQAAERVVAYSSGSVRSEMRLAPISLVQLAAVKAAGLGRLDLSLYANEAEIHDNVTRTPSSFAATLATARNARSVGLPVGIHFVPISGIDTPIGEVLALAHHLGAVRFHILALTQLGRGRSCMTSPEVAKTLTIFLASLPQPAALEVILSSELRRLLGLRDMSQRDRWQARFLDVNGYLYLGEAQRGMRSRRSLKDGASFTQLMSDIRLSPLPVVP